MPGTTQRDLADRHRVVLVQYTEFVTCDTHPSLIAVIWRTSSSESTQSSPGAPMPRDSRLPPEDIERFFRIWKVLLRWVGAQKPVLGNVTWPASPEENRPIRDALWAEDALRHAWIEANPDGMSPEDLALVQSWDHRVAGKFIIAKHYVSHSVFLGGDGRAFAVLGLNTHLRDMVPRLPAFVQAVLIPYEGRITYDGLLGGFPITFGAGMRRRLGNDFKRIKERGEVLHSLEPGAAPSLEDRIKVARKANTSVLRAYSTSLRAQRHSDAIRARDLDVAESLGESLGPERSLAVLQFADFERFVAASAYGPFSHAALLTSLKRFVAFLGRSARMDEGVADDVHRWLRVQRHRR